MAPVRSHEDARRLAVCLSRNRWPKALMSVGFRTTRSRDDVCGMRDAHSVPSDIDSHRLGPARTQGRTPPPSKSGRVKWDNRHSARGASLVAVLLSILIMGILAAVVVIQLDLLGKQTDEITSATSLPTGAGASTGGIASAPAHAARTTCQASVQAVNQIVERYQLLNGVAPSLEEVTAAIAGSDTVPFGPTPDPQRAYAIDYSVGPDGNAVVVGRYQDGTAVANC